MKELKLIKALFWVGRMGEDSLNYDGKNMYMVFLIIFKSILVK